MLDKINERIAKLYGAEPTKAVEKILWELLVGKHNEVIDECLKIIKWYQTTIAPDLPSLYEQKKALSTQSVYLAMLTAQAGKAYRTSYVKRKTTHATKAVEYSEEDSVSRADLKAIKDTQEERNTEALAESAHEFGRSVLTQINKVLDAMTQEIADLRTEQRQVQ